MSVVLQGLLIGLAIAAILLMGDYMMLRRMAAERAKKQHKTLVEFDSTERARLRSVATFCVILPLGLAVAFWLIWG
jgi:lysylphosphatidylglycerol synthetase-like protein (DUF2156 family)